MSQLKETPDWLRAGVSGRPIKVDRENNVLRGYVVAQLGDFKDKRGTFTLQSLLKIVELGNKNPAGLKMRFTHPTACNDGLGTYLGRAKDLYLSETTTFEGLTVPAVRADGYISQTAMKPPPGNGGTPYGQYVMDLAEDDSSALSSSLVLNTQQIEQLDDKKRPKLDKEGEPLPPIWIPLRLHASDIVETGAAVDGLLSMHGLSVEGAPDELVFKVAELLGAATKDATREELSSLLSQYAERYLSWRFGEELAEEVVEVVAKPTGVNDRCRRRLKLLEG